VKLLGLIGHPLTHSFSADYFNKKFERLKLTDFNYALFDFIEISDIRRWAATHPDLLGLNVTIPFKEKIIPYLDQVDKNAKKIGAINTIRIYNDTWKGYNTDYIGFRESLKKIIRSESKLNALILGCGGSAKTVSKVLLDMEIQFQMISRKESKDALSYDQLNSGNFISDSRLIINTTPLGMHPDINSLPAIEYNQISDKHILYDLVYNPEKTAFLLEGEKRGARIKNGLEMLYIQAEQSWKIWTNNLK
jgi:shikimate dehydrogenase